MKKYLSRFELSIKYITIEQFLIKILDKSFNFQRMCLLNYLFLI